MCKYEPDAVYRFLLAHNEYHPHRCLKIVKSYGLCDAHALLLEKIDDFEGALQVRILKRKERREGRFFLNGIGIKNFMRKN